MLNAGIIARVSTEMQDEKGSLDIQIDKNLKYCMENNINPVRIYKQTISGGNKEVLQTEVRQDIESGLINCIVMWEISRLARVASWVLNEVEYYMSKNIKVIIVSSPTLDIYNPDHKFMLHIQSGFAELEKNKILERSASSMEQRKLNGERMAGNAPYGFKRLGKDLWEKKEEEYQKLLECFELFNKLESANKVAKELGWSIQIVMKRLTNVTYIAKNNFKVASKKISWQEVMNLPKLNAIRSEDTISFDLFKSVYMRILKNSESVKRGINDSEYLLSGLVKCSCGGKFYGSKVIHKGKDYSRYVCFKCHKTIQKFKLEGTVIDNLKVEVQNFDDVDKYRLDVEKLQKKRKKLNIDLAKLESSLQKKHFERLKKLDDKIITIADFDYLRADDEDKKNKMKNKIQELEDTIIQFESRNQINNKEKLVIYLEQLEGNSNIHEKKKVFRILINEVFVLSAKYTPDLEIEIIYNF